MLQPPTWRCDTQKLSDIDALPEVPATVNFVGANSNRCRHAVSPITIYVYGKMSL